MSLFLEKAGKPFNGCSLLPAPLLFQMQSENYLIIVMRAFLSYLCPPAIKDGRLLTQARYNAKKKDSEAKGMYIYSYD